MSATVKQHGPDELWRIAEAGDVEELDRIFSHGANVNARNKHGMTALMKAACNGHERMVRALLTRGADPNLKRNDKFTALALAAFFGHTETVRILIEHGAKPETITRCGASAYTWATLRTCHEAARCLESHTPAPTTPAPATTVKTLKDPPEIWDLVQEVPRGFNARSAFVARLKSMKTRFALRFAAAAVVSVACVVGVLVLRGSKARSVQVDSPANQSMVAGEVSTPLKVETTSNEPAVNSSSPEAAEFSHHSASSNDTDKRSRKMIWTRQIRSRSADVEEPVQTVQSREVPAAAPVITTPQLEPRQSNTANTALSPQLITPAKSATPKAKVIQWP